MCVQGTQLSMRFRLNLVFKIQQPFSRINSLGKEVRFVVTLFPLPTKHFIRSYNEAGLLWNRSFTNCFQGYIHRMMAAQSKKRQKQRLIQVSSDIRLILLNLKENCLVKHTDLWKPTTTANPRSSYPHTHLPNPNTYHLVLEEWRALCLAPEAAMVWVTAVLHKHPQIQYYLSSSTCFSWFGLQMARETMLAYDKLIVLQYIPFQKDAGTANITSVSRS